MAASSSSSSSASAASAAASAASPSASASASAAASAATVASAASCPGVQVTPGVVVRSVLLLLLSSDPVRGNYTVLRTNSRSNDTSRGLNIPAIVAPTVILGVLVIVLAVLAWLFCVVRKKRQTEGTYMPSAEEQSGVRGVAAPDALKLPKEERLI